MTGDAGARRRAIVSASLGTTFPSLGVQVSGGEVKTLYRRRTLGQLKGARAELLPGRHIDQGQVLLGRLLTGTTPYSASIVFISFADGSYHEGKLTGGFTVEGMIRKAQEEVRRFNGLAALAGEQ